MRMLQKNRLLSLSKRSHHYNLVKWSWRWHVCRLVALPPLTMTAPFPKRILTLPSVMLKMRTNCSSVSETARDQMPFALLTATANTLKTLKTAHAKPIARMAARALTTTVTIRRFSCWTRLTLTTNPSSSAAKLVKRELLSILLGDCQILSFCKKVHLSIPVVERMTEEQKSTIRVLSTSAMKWSFLVALLSKIK